MLEVLLIIDLIVKQLQGLTGLAAKLQDEGRDPTPEELQAARDARKAANDAADAAGI